MSDPTPDYLLAWRRKHGMTALEAAAALGVGHRTWQGWEGGAKPQHPRLLAHALLGYDAQST